MVRLGFFVVCIAFWTIASSQTLGGNAAYNFLKLPASPLVAAGGGMQISYRTAEVSLTANNPSLLHPELNTQLNASFNAFLGQAKAYSLTGAKHIDRLNTTFGAHVQYLNYGSIQAADAAGNINGEFRPVDFVVQLSAGRKYLEKWTYGATLKFIHSAYQQFRSSAVAMDVGVHFHDSANLFSASFLARNMGVQLTKYASNNEDLPFDLQIGITKRLAKAPFAFSLTAQQLHRFDITYNDTTFNSENNFSSPGTFDKLFNHFVLATHVYLGQHLEAIAGYNHLRRRELSVPGAANGLAGFSAGLRIKFSKLQILYARSTYQRGVSYNQIGITAALNKLTGLGD